MHAFPLMQINHFSELIFLQIEKRNHNISSTYCEAQAGWCIWSYFLNCKDMNFRCFNDHHCHRNRYCHCCRDAHEQISLVWLFLVISSGFLAFGAQDSVMPHLPLAHFLRLLSFSLTLLYNFPSLNTTLFETLRMFCGFLSPDWLQI